MSGKEHVNILLFNKWDTSKIEVNDPGLAKGNFLKTCSRNPDYLWKA